MKPFAFFKPAAIAGALVAAAILSGCGSNDNDNGGSTTSPTPTPVIDAFFAAVSGIVSSSSETTEGNTIEAITATLPENTEPEPLG